MSRLLGRNSSPFTTRLCSNHVNSELLYLSYKYAVDTASTSSVSSITTLSAFLVYLGEKGGRGKDKDNRKRAIQRQNNTHTQTQNNHQEAWGFLIIQSTKWWMCLTLLSILNPLPPFVKENSFYTWLHLIHIHSQAKAPDWKDIS